MFLVVGISFLLGWPGLDCTTSPVEDDCKRFVKLCAFRIDILEIFQAMNRSEDKWSEQTGGSWSMKVWRVATLLRDSETMSEDNKKEYDAENDENSFTSVDDLEGERVPVRASTDNL